MKGLEALKDFREHYFFELDEEENLNAIEKELKDGEKNKQALEFIKKCFYVAKSSGAILLTDYGFEHKEELKEVLL